MPRTLKVIADMTLHHQDGDVKVQNDGEGNVVIHFPNNKTFNSFLKAKLPPGKSGGQLLRKANTPLYEQHQPVILRVRDEDWIVLGRSKSPDIKYAKVAIPYLAHSFSWKTALYVAGSGISAALAYLFFRKRN